jgi:hypothetical protein
MTSKTLVHRRAEDLIARPAIEAALERALALGAPIRAAEIAKELSLATAS